MYALFVLHGVKQIQAKTQYIGILKGELLWPH
jgi:hypothetical protein